MKPKPLVFHRGATADINEAFTWYAKRSEVAAANFLNDVEAAERPIVEAPQRWARHYFGTRRYLLKQFPFALVYRELDDCVQIVAVWHGKRRTKTWKSRLAE